MKVPLAFFLLALPANGALQLPRNKNDTWGVAADRIDPRENKCG